MARLAVAVYVIALATCAAGCRGAPDPIEWGDDWAGSEVFTLADVSGQAVLVGIDPRAGKAEALSAVMSSTDPEDIAGPAVVGSQGGPWFVASGDRHDRIGIRLVDPAQEALTEVGSARGSSVLQATDRDFVGLDADRKTLVVIDRRTFTVERTIHLHETADRMALSASTGRICQEHDNGSVHQISTVDFTSGAQTVVATLRTAPTALSCPDGHPVVASNGRVDPATAELATGRSMKDGVEAHRESNVTVLTVKRGVGSAIAATAQHLYLGISTADSSSIVTIDRNTLAVLQSVSLPSMPTVQYLVVTAHGVVAVGADRAAVIQGAHATEFELPGTASFAMNISAP